MKKAKKGIAMLLALTSIGAMVGCNQTTNSDTKETLEIYLLEAGYGTKWLDDMVALFKTQQWVKDKYPSLEVIVNTNDVKNYAQTRMDAGASSNTLDLLMGTFEGAYCGVDKTGKEQLLDLTEVLYNSTVPGENVTVKQKMNESVVNSFAYYEQNNVNGEPKYYYAPWAGGMMSFVYNADILESLNIAVPNTTDEFIVACETIKNLKDNTEGKYSRGYSILQSKDADYWVFTQNGWWAQYEGVENFYNFWNGIDDNKISKDIFKQQGRLKNAELYETLLKYDTYLDPSSMTYEFMPAQTMMLQGKAVFHMNGDWFDNEMAEMKADYLAAGGTDYELKLMRYPVVSAIIEKCPTIENDQELSALITAIDANSLSLTGEGYDVSQADFNRVKEARYVVNSIGPRHTAGIPSYANGKEVAIDFLRFMATDIANHSYSVSTNGASLPYNYNIKEVDPVAYEKFSPMQKDRLAYFGNSNYQEVVLLPTTSFFPLAKYGGVSMFSKGSITETFRAAGNTKTALDFYNETLEYWTDARWSTAVSNAGIMG